MSPQDTRQKNKCARDGKKKIKEEANNNTRKKKSIEFFQEVYGM